MIGSRNSNKIIKGGVILCDFVVLNALLCLALSIPDLIPAQLLPNIKFFFTIPNVALAFAETLFHSIINARLVSFRSICIRTACLAFTQSALTLFAFHYLTETDRLANVMLGHLALFYLLLILSRIVERTLLSWYRSMGRNTCRVVFIGHDRALVDVYEDLTNDPATGYIVVGYYADENIPDAPQGLERIGTLADLEETVRTDIPHTQPHECFCCLSHDYSDFIVRLMRYCDKHIIHFYYIPRKFGDFHLHMEPQQLGRTYVFSNLRLPLLEPTNQFIKRTFDIVFSSIVCLCLLPIIPIVALIQQIQSRGPVFFKQKRTGLNGRDFYCYKFRSMHVNKEADTAQATKNDPRKFPFGNFIRRTNIDELPQFFNVLLGDMSIVGPRPHMLHHTEVYSELINKYMVRHFCKPGITGWAQVTGFRGETKELWEMKERIQRDIWYIEHYSFWLDLKIIAKTALSVIRPDHNAY